MTPASIASGLGLVLPKGPGPASGWTQASATFAQIEAQGCPAIWLTDHLFFPADTPDALTMAAVAAAATSNCVIGTGVLQLPLRQVAAVAKSASTLNALSGGRFVLGVGIGEHREEYERAGSQFAGRGEALDRGIKELRDFWSPGNSWFEQHPAAPDTPIWVGGRSDASMRRAAEVADGWFPMFISPNGFARRSAQLDELMAEVGRESSAVVRSALVIASIDRPGWSAGDALHWMSKLFRADPVAIERHIVTGTANQVVDSLAAFRDAGADHVAVLLATDDAVVDHGTLSAQWC